MLVVEFPEKILIHLLVRIQDETVAENVERERSDRDDSVVFHDKINSYSCRVVGP